MTLKISLDKTKNIFLLIVGFAMGQGTVFLSQSYLLVKGDYVLSFSFSFGLSLAVIGGLLIDGGGLVILARQLVEGQRSLRVVSEKFSALVVFRALMCTIYLVLVAVFFVWSSSPARFFLLPTSIGMLAWVANVAGVLDGLSVSGLSGLTAALPFAFSGALLPFLTDIDIETACAAAGSAFAFGSILAVCLQHAIIRMHFGTLVLRVPTRQAIAMTAWESVRFQLAFMPGQLISRGQLLLAEAFLSPNSAAIFAYGKQAVNAGQQIVGFARRASFPDLVARTMVTPPPASKEVFFIQKTSIKVMGIVLSIQAIAGLAMLITPRHALFDLGFSLLVVAPVVLSASLFAVLGQLLQAQGRFLRLSSVTMTVTTIAILASWATIEKFGIVSLVFAEVLAHAVGLLLLMRFQRTSKC